MGVRSRSNTILAVAYDLKVFFTVVGKAPRDVVAADLFAFIPPSTRAARPGGFRRSPATVVGLGGTSVDTLILESGHAANRAA